MPTSEKTQTRPAASRAADHPVQGATMVAEAPTAEAALAEVHAAYGPDARIVEAKRVLRGGVGGFFAKEVVQIHAAEGAGAAGAARVAVPAPVAPQVVAEVDAAEAGGARPVAPSVTPRQSAAHRVTPPRPVRDEPTAANPIDRLLAEADAQPEQIDFATFLRRQFEPDTAVAASDPGPDAGSEDVPAPTADAAEAPASGPAEASDFAARARAAASEVIAEAVARSGAGHTDLGGYERPAWADAPAGSTVTDLDAAATPAPAAPARHAPEPVVATPGEEVVPDGRAWSRTTLVRLGLPVAFVQGLEVADPADDAAWTFALVDALRPLCRPLPTGRALVVGPRARSLATAIGLPVTGVGKPLLALGDVAAAVTGSPGSLDWMERARRGRWVHLVVGGKGWRDLLHVDPLAVSWAGDEDLPEAVRVALELGLVLGYGPGTGRARPLDLALALRDLVPEVR